MRRAICARALIVTLALAGSALAVAAPEKAVTASGNVSRLEAAERTVFVTLQDGSEARFVWNAETKINGTLAVGAKVTIRYTELPDGQNLAHQISVRN